MQSNNYTVKLKTIVEELKKIKPLHLSQDYESILLTTVNINRPALQLTGYYDYFDNRRPQLIGRVESAYLGKLTPEERYVAFERLFEHEFPCLIVCHGVEPYPECIALAEKYDRCLFVSPIDTSDVVARIIQRLHWHLAPRITIHGVLVEIYGEGVLLMGDSGIGKSETALELIKRGHRLIADDAVEIKQVEADRLEGSAPELIRYYMELRGIGVINVRRIYGFGAIKSETNIDMVVKLEPWEQGKFYDRLGIEDETETILNVELPSLTIPVRPGRNLAVILELAAMNNRQKKMGYNAALELAEAHDKAIDNNSF